MASIALSIWQAAVEGAVRELSDGGLNLGTLEVTERSTIIPENLPGAFIPLIGPNESVQVGLVSTPAGCLALSRALLQGAPDMELTPSDVADALSEAVNILAGFVKRNIQEHVNPVQLGLPLYLHGHLETSERVRAMVSRVKFGPVEGAVVVLRAAEWRTAVKAA